MPDAAWAWISQKPFLPQDQVVATGRHTDKVGKALGEADHPLIVKLDVTKPTDAEAAVKSAVDRFGGIVVLVNNAAYAASKFGLEGWMESLRYDVAPFGIKTTIVDPGFFRTELLEPESTFWAERSIDDYAARNPQFQTFFTEKNGKQEGDPAKLAKAYGAAADYSKLTN